MSHITVPELALPQRELDWKDEISAERPAVVYCAFGHEISQGVSAAR